MNEVLASLAGRVAGADVHPNDHVNASQSSNDTFPTAIHVAADAGGRRGPAARARRCCTTACAPRPRSSPALVKSGRTHLMDATPVMLGQELGGYAATLALAPSGSTAVLPRVRELPLGGTAVGTGINTPAGFAAGGRSRARRADRASRSPRRATTSRPRAAATRSSSCSGVLRTIAVGLTKICNDLRWMAQRPDHRARRDPPARPAAGLEHHARQGQPGAARGDPDGLRAGGRQRRRP